MSSAIDPTAPIHYTMPDAWLTHPRHHLERLTKVLPTRVLGLNNRGKIEDLGPIEHANEIQIIRMDLSTVDRSYAVEVPLRLVVVIIQSYIRRHEPPCSPQTPFFLVLDLNVTSDFLCAFFQACALFFCTWHTTIQI